MRIGFFDSGMGGLTVLKKAIDQFPQQDYVYYADSDYAPYGVKSREEVLACCHRVVQFLLQKEVELIVVACNTATSIAIEELRKCYQIPIIGIEPAIKPALMRVKDGNERILVTATPLTLKERKIDTLLKEFDKNNQCDLLPLPQLVRWAEQGEFSKELVAHYLKEELEALPVFAYHQVVLGCTHFPLFKPAFKEVLGGSIQFIDGGDGVVKRMATFIPEPDKRVRKIGSYEFYRNQKALSMDEVLLFFNQLND